MTSTYADLSVVVPARNEAANIAVLLGELAQAFPGAELIVVDNASTDDTTAQATRSGFARVLHEPAPGKGHAMRAGAAAATRELLLFHDADLEYSPVDARALVDAVRKQPDAMAVGVRTASFGRPAWSSLFASATVRRLLQWRWGRVAVGDADVLCGTRAMSTALFKRIGSVQAGFRIETELTRRALRLGVTLVNHTVTYR